MIQGTNTLTIDTADYLEKYREAFNKLIQQKDKDRSAHIDQIMIEVRDQKIFKIEGDHAFKEEVYDSIKTLLQVKPGRLLIKELTELVPKFPSSWGDYRKPILIKSGNKDFHYCEGIVEMIPNTPHDTYNALFGAETVVSSKPRAINLAHELIHELHSRKEGLQEIAKKAQDFRKFKAAEIDASYDDAKNIKTLPCLTLDGFPLEGFEQALVFKKMDNPEEQDTIAGVNIPKFLKNGKKLNKLDIICENAFLCALNCLPRVDHKEAEACLVKENASLTQDQLSHYYTWLAQKLDERNVKAGVEYPQLVFPLVRQALPENK